jgi:hypothetical protein
MKSKKNIIVIITLMLISNFSNAQELSSAQKKEWKKELQKMEESDQYYRVMMDENPKFDNDSIWRLQSISDSINKQKFIELTNKYGYPTFDRVGFGRSLVLILHFTLENDFLELKDLFKDELDKGNMPSKEYAWWFDRCQRNMGLPIYYGQYTNDKFCGEQLNIYNDRRKEIGLEALQPNSNCE